MRINHRLKYFIKKISKSMMSRKSPNMKFCNFSFQNVKTQMKFLRARSQKIYHISGFSCAERKESYKTTRHANRKRDGKIRLAMSGEISRLLPCMTCGDCSRNKVEAEEVLFMRWMHSRRLHRVRSSHNHISLELMIIASIHFHIKPRTKRFGHATN